MESAMLDLPASNQNYGSQVQNNLGTINNTFHHSPAILQPVSGAAFDSHDEEYNARCYDGTRTELLLQIRE
ncbi:hypothetical protein QBC38DRAFT_452668 [Podospora fimiseda]|uniref:Uncharacterized protein n=1 Tax=Podospora fimiseda TaxID=252190 RepID=A0AAN7BW33_9PEZI|nr:hypothetical protein QBC38DRAFT_452668 [Podospora fimiseda]